MQNHSAVCSCGSAKSPENCCLQFISGLQVPETAEQLMRSRYSAFTLEDAPYLLATWHPTTRPSRIRFNNRQRWLGLAIRSTENGTTANEGFVEFVARFKIDGKGHRLHERSRFIREDDRWFYIDGEHFD